jgi:hypothetical protein
VGGVQSTLTVKVVVVEVEVLMDVEVAVENAIQ